MTILITGGSGFIGRGLVKLLSEKSISVKVVDLNPFPDPDIETIVGDLRDPEVVKKSVNKVEGIIHLAALTSVLESIKNPFEVYRTNLETTALLLEAGRKQGIKNFLLASTNAVIGNKTNNKFNESSSLDPLTPYGGTKAASEMLLSCYSSSYDIVTSAIRMTNIYGTGMQHKDSFIPRLMKAAIKKTKVEIFGDGEQLRDYLYLTDAVFAFYLALKENIPGPLTIGYGESISVNTLYSLVCEVIGMQIPAHRVEKKSGEMRAVEVDISRALSLGFKPSVSIKEGLIKTWKDLSTSAL